MPSAREGSAVPKGGTEEEVACRPQGMGQLIDPPGLSSGFCLPSPRRGVPVTDVPSLSEVLHRHPAQASGVRKVTGARDRGGEVARAAMLLRLQKAFQLAAQTSVPVLRCIYKT